MAQKTTREQIAELQGILPYADADPTTQAAVDVILGGQQYDDVSRAKRDQVDALLGPRPLRDLDPTNRWLIKLIRDHRRTNRMLTAMIHAIIRDGALSYQAMVDITTQAEANPLSEDELAELFGDD